MFNQLVPDRRRRCLVARTDAGGCNKAHLVRGIGLQAFKQHLAASHHAGQRCTDTHAAAGRRVVTFAYQIKMVIKAGNFPDFCHGKAHQVCKRGKMAGRQASVVILNQMQRLDQHIAARRRIAQQGLYFCQGSLVDHTAFGLIFALATAGFATLLAVCWCSCFVHLHVPP